MAPQIGKISILLYQKTVVVVVVVHVVVASLLFYNRKTIIMLFVKTRDKTKHIYEILSDKRVSAS